MVRLNISSWFLVRPEPEGRSTHHVPGQLVAGQVLDVLVFCVDDLRQLPPVDHFFINPHVDHGVEAVGRFHVVADDLGDGGTPEGDETSKEDLKPAVLEPSPSTQLGRCQQDVTSEGRVIPGEAETTKTFDLKLLSWFLHSNDLLIIVTKV